MKIISGGDVGVEATAIRFAVSHNIDTEINTSKDGEVLHDQRGLKEVEININKKWSDKNGGRQKALEYNIKHSDITIFIAESCWHVKENFPVHKLCERHRKNLISIEIGEVVTAKYIESNFPRCNGSICVGSVSDGHVHSIEDVRIILNNLHPEIIYITGQKDINKDGAIKILKELFANNSEILEGAGVH